MICISVELEAGKYPNINAEGAVLICIKKHVDEWQTASSEPVTP